jgi:hypothetical protein
MSRSLFSLLAAGITVGGIAVIVWAARLAPRQPIRQRGAHVCRFFRTHFDESPGDKINPRASR